MFATSSGVAARRMIELGRMSFYKLDARFLYRLALFVSSVFKHCLQTVRQRGPRQNGVNGYAGTCRPFCEAAWRHQRFEELRAERIFSDQARAAAIVCQAGCPSESSKPGSDNPSR